MCGKVKHFGYVESCPLHGGCTIAVFLFAFPRYYALYDSSNRQDLINAYHDQAFFSLYTCNYKQMNTK